MTEGLYVTIIAGDDVMRCKPHPEAFNQTLDVLGGKSEETMIVGDAKNDIFAGKAAGAATCLYIPQENELYYDFADLQTSEPDFAITQMTDLIGIVEA